MTQLPQEQASSASFHINSEKTQMYWSSVKPNIQGMLGGFANLNVTDINSSRAFISMLRKEVVYFKNHNKYI